jgi:ubiquinone/menaquinone biosynthesis C-methylase UbiE
MASDPEPTAGLDAARRVLSGALHHGVRRARDHNVVEGICKLVPSAGNMLDVGCSDGRIAAQIAERLGITDVQGVDVQLQPDAAIRATRYDGRELPFTEESFDLVTIVDVLHHAEDPAAVLRESLRVLRPDGRIIIKDHLRRSTWSALVLLAMDNASNFSVHTLASGHYLSLEEWVNLIGEIGGRIQTMVTPLVIHEQPWRLVARSSYQVLFCVTG